MTRTIDGAQPRVEAALKVTGTALYEGDRPFAGLLHAALVCAPIASGRVQSIDASRALELGGAISVMTHENAPRIANPTSPIMLQDRTVHFVGQPVAVVLADSLLLARRAAAAIDVTYEEFPAITMLGQALDMAYPPKTAGYVATDSRRGDPERALEGANAVIERRYTTPTNNHLPLEPQCVVAWWEGDDLTVHTTTQAVFSHRQRLAGCFGLPAHRIRIVSQHLGGGFGAKGSSWFPGLVLGVMAARHARRPVKFELTRSQMFTLVGRRQETIQDVKLGSDPARPSHRNRAPNDRADLDLWRVCRPRRDAGAHALCLPQCGSDP